MISIVEAVKLGAKKLNEAGVDNPEHDSLELLSAITGITRIDYLVRGKEPILDDKYGAFEKAIERRLKHEPLQHILGKAWFYGREYIVNKNVLVPRSDTEVLIEHALKVIKDGDYVLDMCTGSGCIIITLALEKRLGRAVGVDLSKEALKVATDNSIKLSADIEFIYSDLFDNMNNAKDKFDVIVSNPPYIETAVIETLAEEVKFFDPMMALDGMEDGLHFYRCITDEAKHFLNKEGWLIYEIGHNQADEVSGIMINAGFTDVRVIKDYAGLDRVVMGKMM